MIIIKGVSLCEKTALETHGFIHNVTLHDYDNYDDILYDITLKSNVQLITRKFGIEIFSYDELKNSYYMNECLFMEVIII